MGIFQREPKKLVRPYSPLACLNVADAKTYLCTFLLARGLVNITQLFNFHVMHYGRGVTSPPSSQITHPWEKSALSTGGEFYLTAS